VERDGKDPGTRSVLRRRRPDEWSTCRTFAQLQIGDRFVFATNATGGVCLKTGAHEFEVWATRVRGRVGVGDNPVVRQEA
jgi:hypothetical protein